MSAIQPILDFGKTHRDAHALEHGNRTISYGELADSIRGTANHLKSLGLKTGDRIGVCLKDTPDHLVALLSVAYMGGVSVSLDWRARLQENLRFVGSLQLSGVLVEPEMRLAEDARAVALDAAWRQGIAVSEPGDMAQVGEDYLFTISATSGSTGAPSFTAMTHGQYRFATAGMLELMGLSGPHRFLCTLPLYYSGGRNSCITHLLRGDSVVLYSSLFRADEYADIVARRGITVGTLVPTNVRHFLAVANDDTLMLPSLTKLFCTGAPLHPQEKMDAVRRISPNFYERYGTAETLAISVLRPEDLADRAESVGRTHSLAAVEIVDDEGRLLPAGAIGRMRVRGPGLGTPLLAGSPDEDQKSKFRDGAFYPGEIAHLDEAGYIFLHGRSSDVIMRSGAKIYPAEVERALAEHPDVAEATVLGRTGSDNEETIVAFVVGTRVLSAGDLLAHCRMRLTPHKIPQTIYFLNSLPLNTAGKIDKAALIRQMEGDGPSSVLSPS